MINKDLPICIIGSGLSGVSAAKGLESKNHPVMILDSGLEYSESVRNNIAELNKLPASEWTEDQRGLLNSNVESSPSGVKEKLVYNSDFASRQLAGSPIVHSNSKFYTSFARGGLSNIWGAGILPMFGNDMQNWPIGLDDLSPHYKKVLEFMPLAGGHDLLEELLPLYTEPGEKTDSRQTTMMLKRMNKNKETLIKKGLFYGTSRLAGNFHSDEDRLDCQYCGMCIYGCPYKILYSSGLTLNNLLKNQNYSYRGGFLVNQLKNENGGVTIYGTDLEGKNVEPVKAGKVILACGAPSTARIVLNSLGLFNKTVKMITSDQLYQPLFSLKGQPRIENENLHTMCQSYWVFNNRNISPYLAHSSLFTYNSLYEKAFKSLLGPLYGPFKPLIKIPLQRLTFMISYLHSNHSAHLEFRISNDVKRTINIKGIKNPDSHLVFKKLKKQVRKVSKYTGLYAVPFYNGEKLPGAGNHFGGAFPMSKNPGELQTDLLGRIPGWDNIHIADSSVFPSITATTISLSIMANSHRISTEIVKD